MWKTMGQLEQMIHISKALDQKLEDKANELDATEPAKAKAIRETALFYTRQRTTDLLTQMAVTVQGYLALDLVKKNNVELIKGVDRASTTTVAALRTAVTVAQAMTNQRLVLEQITSLNTTTANIIDSTGELLKSQTGEIHQQAASSTIPLETLQRAFQNIYDTMDTIDTLQARGARQHEADRRRPSPARSRRAAATSPAPRASSRTGSPAEARRPRRCSGRSRAERMARTPRSVEEAIARFDEYSARLDGHTPAASSAAAALLRPRRRDARRGGSRRWAWRSPP